jgi:hypothetical protein
MPKGKRPPDPTQESEWNWKKDEKGKMIKLGLCLHGWEKCNPNPNPDPKHPYPQPQDGEIWCVANPKCDQEDKPCQCWLFWAEGGGKWQPFPEPKKKQPYNDDYHYACFCVRIL